MSENLALRLKEVPMPQDYFDYYTKLSEEVFTIFEQAASAKATLADSSGMVEPKIAFDLADRVSKMHDIDVTDNLRALIQNTTKELAALKLAEDIAQGKYSGPETGLQEKLDLAVRVALAIVTEGVTIAPLQGISEVLIKKMQTVLNISLYHLQALSGQQEEQKLPLPCLSQTMYER